ncbi:hypothetical protein Nmel_007566 [Mimus melanotis]
MGGQLSAKPREL